ncbi:MAG TPA: hypothetical protein EYO88_11930, partial [Alphaproteobacteria bacterium]|nr:hypothetical protein [Alphaproteobacteria bacterium]
MTVAAGRGRQLSQVRPIRANRKHIKVPIIAFLPCEEYKLPTRRPVWKVIPFRGQRFHGLITEVKQAESARLAAPPIISPDAVYDEVAVRRPVREARVRQIFGQVPRVRAIGVDRHQFSRSCVTPAKEAAESENESVSIILKFSIPSGSFCFKGDTLASALLANGIHLVGRSFKYHRPRGILGSGSEEPNAIVQIIKDKAKTDPNIRATQIEIYEGLETKSQNCWPSVNFDVGEINS